MARIRPYESQVSSQADLPERNASGQDFGGGGLIQLGQAVESFGSSAGQVQRFMLEQKARQEVTDTQVEHANFTTEFTNEVDELGRTWKRGDPPISEQIAGKLKVRLDELNGGEEGSRFETAAGAGSARTHSAQVSSHFIAIARQMDAKLAGEAAVTQHNELVDTKANALQTTPAMIDHARAEVRQIVMDNHGIYGRLPVAEREKMLREDDEKLSVSAVQGLIRKTPNRALEILSDPLLAQDARYGWIAKNIPNEKMQPLIHQAEQEVDAQDTARRQAEAEVRRQHTELQHRTDQSLTAKFVLSQANPGNPNYPPLMATDVGHAMQAGTLEGGTGRAIMGMLKESTNEHPIKTDQGTYWKLFRDIHAPPGDPNRLTDLTPIYKAAGELRQLSPPDMDRLRKEFVDARDEQGQKLGTTKANFLSSMKPTIDTSIIGKKLDQQGSVLFGEFQYLVDKKVEQYTKEGKDPAILFNPDPNNTEYLGIQAKLPPFHRTLGQQIESSAAAFRKQPGLPKQQDTIQSPNTDTSKYGNRTDGTQKGLGFFGELKGPDGKVSTEFSTDEPIDASGKKVLHPLMVPSLTRPEIEYLLSDRKDNKTMETSIFSKAAEHARARIKAGKSPFAGPGEQHAPPSNAGGIADSLKRQPGETAVQYLRRIQP